MGLREYAKLKDVTELFKTLIPWVKGLRPELQDFILKHMRMIEKKMMDAAAEIISEKMDGHTKHMDTMSSKIEDKLAKIRDGIDGKDADEAQIVAAVLNAIKIPTMEDIRKELPTLGEGIRDSLELLSGEERLDIKYLKGLEDLEKRLGARITAIGGGTSRIGIQAALGKIIKHQTFSTSSATTTLTLNDKVAGGVALWLRYNGQVLTYGTHYTISGTTITLLLTLDDDTKMDATYITG